MGTVVCAVEGREGLQQSLLNLLNLSNQLAARANRQEARVVAEEEEMADALTAKTAALRKEIVEGDRIIVTTVRMVLVGTEEEAMDDARTAATAARRVDIVHERVAVTRGNLWQRSNTGQKRQNHHLVVAVLRKQ